MNYRRLFIIRKDLNMSAGKLAAQLSHCAEQYWLNLIRKNASANNKEDLPPGLMIKKETGIINYSVEFDIDKEIFENYINGGITKTVCAAKNKYQLLKAVEYAKNLELTENIDFGLIFDACHTELIPEEENGTCLTGIWFKPLPDEIAQKISKKYQLYK